MRLYCLKEQGLHSTACTSLFENTLLPLTFKSLLRPDMSSRLLHGFKELRRMAIPEISVAEALELQHVQTGARLFHFQHDSPAAFSVGFRTLPEDSRGAPHILEHVTLCGSKAFPVRDPFFKMLHRSMAVYMNAWTASDFTQYPFVTENAQDYRNLRSIYLDAVFNPLLERDDFLQEGWRLEVSPSAGGSSSPCGSKGINFAGVVFNEMKGALSDADSLFLTRFQQARFGRGSVYGVVSGGDPLKIPNLRHEDLVAFHRKFYDPSNSVTVCSGNRNDLLTENLRTLDNVFSSTSPASNANLSTLNHLPKTRGRIEIDGPLDPLQPDPSSQVRFLISYLTNSVADLEATFAFKILNELLFSGPSSPFHQELIVAAGLGSDFAPGTGYDSSSSLHSTLSFGLQGVKESNLSAVEAQFDNLFVKIRQEPETFFPAERVETALHQIDLALRYAPANFGLSLAAGTTRAWVHGVDPLASWNINAQLATFKSAWNSKGPSLFTDLLDRFVFNGKSSCSTTKMVFVMRPNRSYGENLQKREAACLKRHIESSNPKNKTPESFLAELQVQSDRLKAKQVATQDLSCLPQLKIAEIETDLRHRSILPTSQKFGWLYEKSTPESNELAYFKLLGEVQAAQFSRREICLLPILMDCLGELGGKGDAVAFDQAVKRHTGGIDFSILQDREGDGARSSDKGGRLGLLVSSYCKSLDNGEAMLDLIREALLDCNIVGSPERVKSIFLSAAASLSSATIAHSGNRFATLKAASLLPPKQASSSSRPLISELLGGLSQAEFLSDISTGDQLDSPDLLKELDALRLKLLKSCDTWRVALIHPGNFNLNHLQTGLMSDLHGEKSERLDALSTLATSGLTSHHVNGPYSSNYSALVVRLGSERILGSARRQAALYLLSQLLRSQHLHGEIREQGGAYGAGCSFNPSSLLMSFSSYRDPSPERSIQIFRELINTKTDMRKLSASKEDILDGAKLALLSSLNGPVDLAQRGLTHFYSFAHPESLDAFRKDLRSAILNCTAEEIESVWQEELVEAARNENENVRSCVIGSSKE